MEWLEGGALLGAAVAAGRDALRLLTSLCWLSVVTRVVLSFSGGLACVRMAVLVVGGGPRELVCVHGGRRLHWPLASPVPCQLCAVAVGVALG